MSWQGFKKAVSRAGTQVCWIAVGNEISPLLPLEIANPAV
jgi:hypothetical protein